MKCTAKLQQNCVSVKIGRRNEMIGGGSGFIICFRDLPDIAKARIKIYMRALTSNLYKKTYCTRRPFDLLFSVFDKLLRSAIISDISFDISIFEIICGVPAAVYISRPFSIAKLKMATIHL
jgi:hypothetical protein